MSPPLPYNAKLINALAIAIVDHPQATLAELAKSAGISRATLYRFCRTRENLLEVLESEGQRILYLIISSSHLHSATPNESLHYLIESHLAHRELVGFLGFRYNPEFLSPQGNGLRWQNYFSALDAFFLRGQELKAFRIDISAAVLTELFLSLVFGIIDAERRGRAAPRSSVETLEKFFLYGSSCQTAMDAL
ncbi:UNVERIFIED_CONTAM: nfxB [Trichonephila clavipes]